MAQDLFNRYIWLVDTIYRAEKITFEEINAKWLRNEMSEGKEIPLRTFHNHRKAIEQMFDINIACGNGYRYYVENADDVERGGVRSWLLNTFAVNNLINESHKLKRRILFEQIPSGQKFLAPAIEAMRDNVSVEISYQGFEKEKPNTFEVEPYCVKVFKQRWYLAARSSQRNKIMIFGLDRVKSLRVTTNKFKLPKNFDADELFSECFGVIIGDEVKAEIITLKVAKRQACYIRALPLHHSQKEVATENDFSTFSYYLKPSFDFKQEILSHGAAVEVLSPKWLRKEIRSIATAMMKNHR